MIEFSVTEKGITTGEGAGIMPGSRLVVKNVPPAWQRLGRVTGDNVSEQKLVVASPKTGAEDTPEANTPVSDAESAVPLPPRDELVADYTELFSKPPHHKMKDETIYAAIQEKLG